MVARSPPKQLRKSAVVPISPTLLRDTVMKVDKCMARLQELQCTVTGGTKMVSGLSLSPRSGRNYSRTSLCCKQESFRQKNASSRRSPPGKLPINTEEWRKMSLPAMLLGETMGEILQASEFAKNIVEAVSSHTQKPASDDPKTPLTERRERKPSPENSGLQARRKREKQCVLQNMRTESNIPSLQRAKSRINFKISPAKNRECEKENCRYVANRVSPRNRPWVKKTVLFPNPLFHSSPTSHHQKFSKTRSPVIARNRQTPHKFLIKSPTKSAVVARNRQTPHKFQVKIKSPPLSISPTRAGKKSPKPMSAAAKLRRSFSPSKLANKFASPLKSRKSVSPTRAGKKSPKQMSTAAKLRRSCSPSRLANKFASPLKSRKSVQKNEGMMKVMSGLKQRPAAASFSVRFSPRRI